MVHISILCSFGIPYRAAVATPTCIPFMQLVNIASTANSRPEIFVVAIIKRGLSAGLRKRFD
jgi:hypothetical protein